MLSYFNVSECFIRQLPNLESLPLKTVYASYNLGLKQLPRLPARFSLCSLLSFFPAPLLSLSSSFALLWFAFSFPYDFIYMIFVPKLILFLFLPFLFIISLTFLDVAEKIESIGIDFGNCINLNTLSMRNNFLKSQEEFNGAGE